MKNMSKICRSVMFCMYEIYLDQDRSIDAATDLLVLHFVRLKCTNSFEIGQNDDYQCAPPVALYLAIHKF